ncbi:MAG TPA: regulatory protein RecX [Gammaproteobacteria bacterium]|nr:regulatory protein RecX [Gammaproteobacteria bacterium]
MPPRKTEGAPPDAEAIALRLLARREHARGELAAKLRARGVSSADAAPVLDRLQAAGLLSDARFVEQLLRTRLRQGYGPTRIRRDLAAKGVAPGSEDTALALGDEEWAARAEAIRRRHFGGDLPTEGAERSRQARFLERRGYAAAHIARVLRGDFEADSELS